MKKPKMIVHNEMVLTAKPGYEKAIEATNPLDRTARKVKNSAPICPMSRSGF